MNFSANPIKRTRARETEPRWISRPFFCWESRVAFLAGPLISDGICSRSRRGSRPRPSRFSAQSSWSPLCSLGTALSSFPSSALDWKGCEVGLILLFVPGWAASLRDTASRIPWFGCSHLTEASVLPEKLTFSLPFCALRLHYNQVQCVELAFTVEMRECPHGKFLPSSFHGGKKVVIAYTDHTS